MKLLKSIVKKNISKNFSIYGKYISDSKSILDVGCGNGLTAKYIMDKQPYSEVTGLDIADYRWEESKDITHQVYDGKKIPYSDNSFETSLLFFVLHHAENPEKLINEVIRVSRKRVLVFEECYHNSIQKVAMIIYDVCVNFLIFGEKISLPRFQRKEEILEGIKKSGIKNVKTVTQKKTIYYPPDRILFVLEK